MDPFGESATKDGRYVSTTPPELRFSCAVGLFEDEEELAEQLATGSPEQRVAAAKELWGGHSRRHSRAVLDLLADPPPGLTAVAALRHAVEVSLIPDSILRELRAGDYRWGAWLAFLRPHPDTVPTLLVGLSTQLDHLPETVLALGAVGDRRALEPLLALLASDDYRTAGDAAQALGYLGLSEVEPALIDALSRDNGWLRVKACRALGRIGTKRAIPALERLAADDGYTGTLNVRGMAQSALESIAGRDGS